MTTTSETPTTPTATRTRHQMIFVNLPITDVVRSRAFFTALGYGFDEEMCNAGALALELGPDHYAMRLSREFFGHSPSGPIAEPGHAEVLTCLSAASRDEVDAIVDAAVGAGGRQVRKEEYGDYMYGRSYADLDGHVWE